MSVKRLTSPSATTLRVTPRVNARRQEFAADYNSPIELFGLYWHFVDVVWIFLFPLLYLIERHVQ